MTQRQVEDYLQDILEAVAAIEEFSAGIDFESFAQNREKVFAVSRAIEIIGGAVKRVPNAVREQHPALPWRDMAGMRDKLIHDYFNTDVEILWRTIQEDIPQLKIMITEVLEDVSKQ